MPESGVSDKMDTKTKILTILRENDTYVSGQQLCNQLGVSRTAVWKVIDALREQGYQIEAVQNKGYKLLSAPDVMSASEIASRIHTKWAGQKIVYLAETDSTNNDCRRLLQEGSPNGTLVVADMQKTGKGRRGRTWISPPGVSIYMTIGLRPEFEPGRASMLTLVMALAICRTLADVTGLNTQIKWPNDIVVNGKKVCGMLTEMSLVDAYIDQVVIGVGVNVNQEQFAPEIAQTATSLRIETGEKVGRVQIIQKSMEYFEEYYEKFVTTCDMSAIMGEYNDALANMGAQVRVLDPKGEFGGIARGIDEMGQLLVELSDGTITAVYAGEVSVRGIYGYV